MTSPRDDRLYPTASKPRGSPPGGDPQTSGFFQAGQGGRTVLPPLSSAFPTSRSPGLFFYMVFIQCAQLVGSCLQGPQTTLINTRSRVHLLQSRNTSSPLSINGPNPQHVRPSFPLSLTPPHPESSSHSASTTLFVLL